MSHENVEIVRRLAWHGVEGIHHLSDDVTRTARWAEIEPFIVRDCSFAVISQGEVLAEPLRTAAKAAGCGAYFAAMRRHSRTCR